MCLVFGVLFIDSFIIVFFFFFKQKTAYEMRISDWSSDVFSSDLFTQELRLASDNTSPFQWLIGGFYSDVERLYSQRLPTPGYDAFTDAVLGAGTSARSEERRVGKECVRTWRSRVAPVHSKKKIIIQ